MPRIRASIVFVSLLIGVVMFVAMSPDAATVAGGLLGPSYQPGDRVRIEYDGHKAVYLVDRVIDNSAEPMYVLVATGADGMLPTLNAAESAIRLDDDHRK